MRPRHLTVPLLAAAVATAAAGWARSPAKPRSPSIRFVSVTPLSTADAGLRDVVGHHLSVRVATTGWPLRHVRDRAGGLEEGPRLRRWRLYVDGRAFGDSYDDVAVTPYLPPGTHWLAAELRGPGHERLRPPVWSEPVVLHMPRSIRCLQTGWRGGAESGRPTFACTTP
jgi:hypothetical protein